MQKWGTFNFTITRNRALNKKPLYTKASNGIAMNFWRQQCCHRRDFYTPPPKKGNQTFVLWRQNLYCIKSKTKKAVKNCLKSHKNCQQSQKESSKKPPQKNCQQRLKKLSKKPLWKNCQKSKKIFEEGLFLMKHEK